MTPTGVVRSHESYGAWRRRWRGVELQDARIFLALSLLQLLFGFAVVVWNGIVPAAILTIPVVLAGLLLKPTQIPLFVGLSFSVLALVAIDGWLAGPPTPATYTRVLVVLVVGGILLVFSLQRSTLGVSGRRAETMLVELRDRIQRQSGLPVLPEDWSMEQALHSAEGTAFAGDFVVATRRGGLTHLELCLVDVSGKGEAAGVRALQLAGALGGILGSLSPDRFLSAANDWVIEQEWGEGFATAVHISVELDTGAFTVWSAGHPPAMKRAHGSGRWDVLQPEGPVLGLIPGAEYEGLRGHLHPGDLLMVCTDGVVESRRIETARGVDRLTGVAERVLQNGFDNGADRVMAALGKLDDDRALVMLRRRESGSYR